MEFLDNAGVVGVFDGGDNEAHDLSAAGAEIGGIGIADVAQLLGPHQDGLAALRVLSLTGKDASGGLGRDSGLLRDGVNGRHGELLLS